MQRHHAVARQRSVSKQGGRVLALVLFVGLMVLFGPPAAQALPSPMTDGWTKVVTGGFNDPNNTYAPSYAKYKDYLYLSTTANESGSMFSHSNKAGGDIWRTKDGANWEQIGTPGLGNTHNSSFNLVVFKDKLYAISYNLNDHGIEIWMTSDGEKFTQIEKGGFGDKDSDSAVGFVFSDRLILGVANVKTGAQIWVSDDGQTFRRVVDGGMGDPGNTGLSVATGPEEPAVVLKGKLYVGVSNPGKGGEIWATADGLTWERVADKGLGRSTSIVLTPNIVYKEQVYATGVAGGSLDKLAGLELFRSGDGTTWEKLVSDGFGVGKERNVSAGLVQFQDKLYLISNTMDPRVLIPGNPSERLAPKGFQLRVSSDGKTWTQIGEDGFGADSSYLAGMNLVGDLAYLSVYDYHEGSQLWRSSDGQNWELIFREPNPSMFSMGGGPLEFKGHLLWLDNDLEHGLEIWRTDAQVVTAVTATTRTGDTMTPVTESQTGSSGTSGGAGGGGAGGAGGTGGAGGGSGLSGGRLALAIALIAVAVAAMATAVVLLIRTSRRNQAGGAGGQTAAVPDDPPAAMCPNCGAPLTAGAHFCAHCGRQV